MRVVYLGNNFGRLIFKVGCIRMGLVDLFRFFNVGFKNKYKYIESFRWIYEVVEVLEIKL